MEPFESELKNGVANAFTVDVEDWFHILGRGSAYPVESWNGLEGRVERNTNVILDLLDTHSTKATFFVLGWVAERYPELVRQIQSGGHEIASHGYYHQLVFDQNRDDFRSDVAQAKSRLEDVTGERVYGYRAPGFSLTKETRWMLDVLVEEGYLYDSSLFPAYRGHGGVPGESDQPRFFEAPGGNTIFEFPISVKSLAGVAWPYTGGGYLRLTPLWMICRLTQAANVRHDMPVNVYVHPREIDPSQPRIPHLSWLRQFKYYYGLRSTESKLSRLLERFSFVPIKDLFASYLFP